MFVFQGAKTLAIAAIAVALGLSACQQALGPATPREIALGASVEQARGHLVAAREDARAGRWDLAAVHAAHPAETMPAIDAAVAERDPQADAALRKGTRDIVQAAQAKDLARLEALIADVDARFSLVAGIVIGEQRASELAYRASVVATLVENVATEYGEAVEGGALRQEVDYQDAYVFLQQALAIWREIDPSVASAGPDEYAAITTALTKIRSAIPSLSAPAKLVAPDEVSALAKTAHEQLRDAVGARTGVAAAGADQLKALTKQIDDARDALRTGDVARARTAYREFQSGWGAIEDGIRAHDRDAYVRIEDGIRAVSDTLITPEHPDTARVAAALAALDETIDDALPNIAAGSASGGTTATFASTQGHLDAALVALDRGDAATANAEMVAFRGDWIDVEVVVKARSTATYGAIENDTAAALSLLLARPADLAGAREAVARIHTALAPFAESSGTYGVFDAAIILLREGFEALLVVAALLAFLAKSGNADKRKWIWTGGGAGILASVGVAVLVNVVFSASTAVGANREILEGVTGLFAAAMLIYVSYWMHSKANISSWQRYIRDKSTSALARNSLLSLALIAFLAVFREGAETALFYLGIAPSIALGDLVLGLAIGAGGLVALGVVMLVFGVRIPIRPFFLVTSLLVYYLAFKFVGAGIHALQVAGIVPATSGSFLPDIGFFGVFPTWETTVVQLALLAAAIGFILYERARIPRQPEDVAAS
jgi:high-affinity iron transporter